MIRKSFSCLLLCSLFLGFSSCDNFLEEVPDDRVALDDLDKAADLVTNAYSIASYAFTDWMTQEFTYTYGTIIRPEHEKMYAWDDPISDPESTDTPTFFWYETYNAIAHANEVLAIIDDLEVDTEDEKRRDAIKAEALLARAYGHFMLVNLFGESFNFSNNGTGLGVPYIKTPETTFVAKYKRLSVSKVLDKVGEDLAEGLKLLDDTFYRNSGKYHFNRNAALAFASRFYLYKGDYIRCLQYSNELLGSNPEAFIRDMTSEEFRTAKSSITGYPQMYSSPDLPSNLMFMRKVSLVQRTGFAFGIDRNYYGSLFGSHLFERGTTDERENPAFIKGQNTLYPSRYERLFERNSINSNVGNPYHIAIAFRGEEVLFNRIEANILSNNLGDVIPDLQILIDRRYRGSDVTLSIEMIRTAYRASSDGSDDFGVLLNYTMLEKNKEFIGQGMRWFVLKKYSIPVIHAEPNGSSTITLAGNDKRKLFQIPTSAIEVGGLKPNPR